MKIYVRRLSGAALFAAALFAICASASSASAAPYGVMMMEGEKHEYTLAGQSWVVTGGRWYGNVGDNTGDGVADSVHIYVDSLPREMGLFWGVDFSSYALGRNLMVGSTYTNTTRIPTTPRPGFDIGGDGREDDITGQFTIHELVVDYSGTTPRLLRFSASFYATDDHGNYGHPELRGSVIYRDDDSPLPASYPYISKAKYARKASSLTIRGHDFESGASVTVDGTTQVTVTKVTPRIVKTKDVTLTPGIHTVVVRNADGGESFPYEIAVFSSFQQEPFDDVTDTEEGDDSQQ